MNVPVPHRIIADSPAARPPIPNPFLQPNTSARGPGAQNLTLDATWASGERDRWRRSRGWDTNSAD